MSHRIDFCNRNQNANLRPLPCQGCRFNDKVWRICVIVARSDKLVTGSGIKRRLTTGNHPPEFHAVGVDKPGGAGIVATFETNRTPMNKHSTPRQTARKRAAEALREWRKTGSWLWREEYRSALQWDKRLEVTP